MMTTLSAMRGSLSMRAVRRGIIGCALLALALLAGCSALRLAYGQGPQLTYWWLDRYLGFSDDQALRVKAGLAQSFAWHRETQLDDYAALLAGVRQQLLEDTTPARVCAVADQVRARLQPIVRQVLPFAAEVAPTLTPAQLARLGERYAKNNDELRRDFLQPDRQERSKASVERAVDRFEDVYGRLDASQRQLVADRVRASPFDAEVWVRDRIARQEDTLRTLQRVSGGGLDRAQTLEALRAWAGRLESPPGSDASAYQERLTRYNCDFAAAVHNTANAAQRRHAADKLKGWEDDLRVLAGAAPLPRTAGTPGIAAAAPLDPRR
jgi:hypothetical protein